MKSKQFLDSATVDEHIATTLEDLVSEDSRRDGHIIEAQLRLDV